MLTLKNHPFAVEAFFECSLVLTYAVNKKELKEMIPECLEVDSFNDKWAFIAAAMVNTKNLRPKGFPSFMGNDFFLIGYRIFVRYVDNRGKRLRGLYILGSETNKKRMSYLGNTFTHYKYNTTDIDYLTDTEKIEVSSKKSDVEIEVSINNPEPKLPETSPFSNWKEARRFAGPLPFTFTCNAQTKKVIIIEGVRENWDPQPVEVKKSNIGFINKLGFKDIVLANAFIIRDIPYYWKKGKIEIWKG